MQDISEETQYRHAPQCEYNMWVGMIGPPRFIGPHQASPARLQRQMSPGNRCRIAGTM